MKHEPPDLCIFDLADFCDRNRSILPSEYDNFEHLKTESGDHSQDKLSCWHPLLDTFISGDPIIGFRHWVDNSKHHRRYGWECHSSEEEDQTKEDK